MTVAASTSTRDTRGRFQPGLSGNPSGKAPGTRNLSTRVRLMLAEGDVEAAGRLIIQKMHEGNLAAARFIIDHVDPKPRGRPIALDVAPDASLVERYAALTNAMLAGELSPQEAAGIARLIERDAALQAAAPARDTARAPRAAAVAPIVAEHPTERQPTPPRAPATPPDPPFALHSACIGPSAILPRTGAPDWRSSVSRAALMAASPASDLNPSIVQAVAAAIGAPSSQRLAA